MDAPAHSAPILKLPDETLLNIVHQLIAGLAKRNLEYKLAHLCKPPGQEVDADEFTHAQLPRLALVSRRFHRIATALLYRSLTLVFSQAQLSGQKIGEEEEEDWGRDRRRTLGLCRAFEENPSLRGCCETLRLHLDVRRGTHGRVTRLHPDAVSLEHVARNVLTWLSNITTLHLQSPELDNGHVLAMICDAASCLPRVRKLMIHKGGDGLPLPTLYRLVRSFPKLDSVTVWEAGRRRKRISYNERFPSLHQDTELPPSLSSITFWSGFEDDPPNLGWFLRQPLRLAHFAFYLRYRGHGDFNFGWSLAALLPHLAHQRETLRAIEIGPPYTRGPSLEGLCLTGFRALEELTLSIWALDDRGGPGICSLPVRAGHAAILSAPKLRKLTLRYDCIQRYHAVNLEDFGDEHEAWLRGLTAAAPHGKAALRHVHIDWRPGRISRRLRIDVYPWDRIDKVQEEVRDAGILITYPSPSVTREEFDVMVVGQD